MNGLGGAAIVLHPITSYRLDVDQRVKTLIKTAEIREGEEDQHSLSLVIEHLRDISDEAEDVLLELKADAKNYKKLAAEWRERLEQVSA